jgi:hypothetical protein
MVPWDSQKYVSGRPSAAISSASVQTFPSVTVQGVDRVRGEHFVKFNGGWKLGVMGRCLLSLNTFTNESRAKEKVSFIDYVLCPFYMY